MDVVLGLNVGATNTRGALFPTTSLTEPVCTLAAFKTPKNDYDAWRQRLNELVSDTIDHKISGGRLVAVGVGIAGRIVDGTLKGAANLAAFKDRDIKGDLTYMFDCPVTVMNDAAAEGLGEYTVAETPLIFVSWGTGIGTATVLEINSRPYVLSTEGGHMTINNRSMLKCGCDGTGHWEGHCGGINLSERFQCPSNEITDGMWRSILLPEFAVGCRNLSVQYPGLPIVIGGGIGMSRLSPASTGAGDLKTLQKLVRDLPATVEPPTLSLAQLDDPGIVGAVHAAQLIAG